MLLGDKAMERLSRARVAVFGIGGVGGDVVEALARSGVGTLDLIDNDCVSLTNLNRQIIALYSTIGMAKVDAAEQRIRQINPEAIIIKHKIFEVMFKSVTIFFCHSINVSCNFIMWINRFRFSTGCKKKRKN